MPVHHSLVLAFAAPLYACHSATCHPCIGACCVRDGEFTSGFRDFNAAVSGARAIGGCAPGRERCVVEHDGVARGKLEKAWCCCQGVETGEDRGGGSEGQIVRARSKEFILTVYSAYSSRTAHLTQSYIIHIRTRAGAKRKSRQSSYLHCTQVYSAICTSSSPAAAGGAGAESVTFATMVFKNGSTFSPSTMRNGPVGGTPFSCGDAGPTIPIEVLFTLSSLSCCSVSRRACRPWRIKSSKLPGRSNLRQNNSAAEGGHVQSAKLS